MKSALCTLAIIVVPLVGLSVYGSKQASSICWNRGARTNSEPDSYVLLFPIKTMPAADLLARQLSHELSASQILVVNDRTIYANRYYALKVRLNKNALANGPFTRAELEAKAEHTLSELAAKYRSRTLSVFCMGHLQKYN